MRRSQNQGDGWTVTSAYLDRFVDDQRLLAANGHKGESEEQAPYLRIMAQAGRRTAELHLALVGQSRDCRISRRSRSRPRTCGAGPARPSPVPTACSMRSAQRDAVRESDRPLVDRLLAQRDALHDRLSTLLPPDIDGSAIRIHGDFRLEQMLIVKDDIFIIGFEGDAACRSPSAGARRRAARDVAVPDPLDRLFRDRGRSTGR